MTRTPTPSLHRRVTIATVAVFAVLLVVVGGAVDHLVGAQLNRDLESRLADGVSRAASLVKAGVGPGELVNQLQSRRIRVQVIGPDGVRYGGVSPASTAPPAPLRDGMPISRDERTGKTVTRVLADGARLTLVANTAGVQARRAQLRREMLAGGAVTLVLVALLVRVAVGRALAPLQRMTSTAERITYGDRGRRLRPDRPRTELGHAAAAFDNMLDALENAEISARHAAAIARQTEAKTRQFLSDAAHELRSPVAAIQAVADQLIASTEIPGNHDNDPTTTRRRRRYAALLTRETHRVTRLVSDLLDIANIDAGVTLPNEEVDLVDIVAAEVDRAAMLAPSLTLHLIGEEHKLPIRADPSRVAQILSNLLDNARRYTPPGGEITVRITACGQQAQVTVTDSGPGIPAADRERVFDRLVRLDDARDRDSGGAGLGLPIARALARAHHGTLECLPRPAGAAFRLTLPTVPALQPSYLG